MEKIEKVSLRIFCHAYGQKKILVLCGYDKGRYPSKARQQKEIARAQAARCGWEARRKSAVKAARRAGKKAGARKKRRH